MTTPQDDCAELTTPDGGAGQVGASSDSAGLDGAHLDAGHQAQAPTLQPGNWAPDVYARLHDVIAKHAHQGRYATVDFDNTTVIYDGQFALVVYRIMHLEYHLSPYELGAMLVHNLTNLERQLGHNMAGQPVSAKAVFADIVSAYTWLWEHYAGFGQGGTLTLEQVRETPQHREFAAKYWFAYSHLYAAFDLDEACPWEAYTYSGLTDAQIRALTSRSAEYWRGVGGLHPTHWQSPASIESQAGCIAVQFNRGLAIAPELPNLYATLRANGIEVYIVSASMQAVVAGYSDALGVGIPRDQVFGLRFVQDGEGRQLPYYDHEFANPDADQDVSAPPRHDGWYPYTWREGKVGVIERLIAPRHGGRGPVLVLGDADGDMNMMSHWMPEDTQLGVIFNRCLGEGDPSTQVAVDQALAMRGQADATLVVQGRDEHTCQLRPSPATRLLGADEPLLKR